MLGSGKPRTLGPILLLLPGLSCSFLQLHVSKLHQFPMFVPLIRWSFLSEAILGRGGALFFFLHYQLPGSHVLFLELQNLAATRINCTHFTAAAAAAHYSN
jgi:hypothetical protein